MGYLRRQGWLVALALGLAVGLIAGGLWPHTPLHAVATDHTETFAMATGFVDDGIEAVYFLDFLTGSLKAAVLSNTRRGFQAIYTANLNRDLGTFIATRNANLAQLNMQRTKTGAPPLPQVQMPQSPNFMMVTGMIDTRYAVAPRMRPGQTVVYVAETNTGVLLAYSIMWSQTAHVQDQMSGGEMTLRAAEQFTTFVSGS
ncbi:MAG: hypothetical protein ACYTG0_07290 [Planctomycetota bacterium]